MLRKSIRCAVSSLSRPPRYYVVDDGDNDAPCSCKLVHSLSAVSESDILNGNISVFTKHMQQDWKVCMDKEENESMVSTKQVRTTPTRTSMLYSVLNVTNGQKCKLTLTMNVERLPPPHKGGGRRCLPYSTARCVRCAWLGPGRGGRTIPTNQ